MANSTIVTACMALGLINFAALLVVVILPQWRVNSWVDSQPNSALVRYMDGLWVRCTKMQNSYFTCDMYDSSIIGLPGDLNAIRAMMIISVVATTIGFLCSLLGMRCISALEEDSKRKRWVVIVGGICHIISGVLTCVCVSWYASGVIKEYYYNPYQTNQVVSYTLGACLYIGWVSACFSLISGCLMTCCACFSKPVDDDNVYKYQPPVAKEKYAMPPSQPASQFKAPFKKESYDKQKRNRSSHHASERRSHHHDNQSSPGSIASSFSQGRESDLRVASEFV